MNLTKTIHKTPVDSNLVRQGWTEQEKARIQPKYDRDYQWVSAWSGYGQGQQKGKGRRHSLYRKLVDVVLTKFEQ